MDDQAIVETIDKRHRWRRSEDFRIYAAVIGLCGALVAGGIGWGTAAAAVSQKVDRSEFAAHVADADKRFLADSLRSAFQEEALRRIESKVDSGNERLRRLVCDGHPTYCR